MKNAKELIEEEERDRKKAEKRRAKKKVKFLWALNSVCGIYSFQILKKKTFCLKIRKANLGGEDETVNLKIVTMDELWNFNVLKLRLY